jgi:hypothetical protein
MVLSVSLWYLFWVPMSSLICFCVFLYSLFLLSWNFLRVSCTFWLILSSGISWGSPVHFGWSCLVISPWNSQWFLAGFLLSECSCGLHCVPCDCLSLFCCGLELGIHFLHFPLNPVLIYFWGGMVSIPLLSSHYSTWCCFCPCSVCNLVLANLQ